MKNIFIFLMLLASYTSFSQLDSRGTPSSDIQAWHKQPMMWDSISGRWNPSYVDSVGLAPNGVSWGDLSIPVQDSIRKDIYIDTLSNYTALRAYTGNSMAVVVQDFIYNFDGFTYTTVGGVFHRVATGSEDGATLLVATNGVKWKRDWDGIHVRPEWWECGKYDHNGILYSSKLTSATGIYNESDRINSASFFVDTHKAGVVELQSGKTYIVDRYIFLSSINGNGAIIKQVRPAVTNIVGSYTAGQTVVTVASVAGLRAGQYICITNNTGTYGGIGFTENFSDNSQNANPIIVSIVGNVVTLNTSGNLSCPASSAFGVVPRLGVTDINSKINYLFLDGDGANKNVVTYDWRHISFVSNPAENMESGDLRGVWQNCSFKNIPGIVTDGSHFTMLDCIADSIGCGIFHYGGVTAGNASQNHSARVDGLTMSNIGFINPWMTSHQEAVFTFSSNVKNIFINNVKGRAIGNSIFGFMGSETDNIVITNSTFEGYKPAWATQALPHLITRWAKDIGYTVPTDEAQRGLRIENCVFNTCGDLLFQGRDLAKGQTIDNIRIVNNKFNNTRISFFNTTSIYMEGNELKSDTFSNVANNAYTYPLSNIGVVTTAMITAVACDRVTIKNNIIEGNETYTANCDYGIVVQPLREFRKDDAGVNTKVWYSTDLVIDNNQVSRVSFGIGNHLRYNDNYSLWSTQITWGTGVLVGSKISNNVIRMHKDAQYSDTSLPIWGIHSLQGVNVFDNVIHGPQNPPTNTYRAIIAWGINVAERPNLMGGTIYNNIIYGSVTHPHSVVVGTGSGAHEMEDNVSIIGNTTMSAIYGPKAHIDLNKRFQTIFAHFTTPYSIPDFNGWRENKNLY
jgi:hypothetical protein